MEITGRRERRKREGEWKTDSGRGGRKTEKEGIDNTTVMVDTR